MQTRRQLKVARQTATELNGAAFVDSEPFVDFPLTTTGNIGDDLERTQEIDVNHGTTEIWLCSMCKKELYISDSIGCDGDCFTWSHAKCAGISEEQLAILTSDEKSKWFCSVCKDSPSPLSQALTEYRNKANPSTDPIEVDNEEDITVPLSLPAFSTECKISSATWGDLSGDEIQTTMDNAYEEVVRWRKNLFKVPTGAIGKDFIAEVTKTLDMFNSSSNMESVAITMLNTMFPLLLQKPTAKSKAKDHKRYLENRLVLWKAGKITELMREGRAIQKKLAKSKNQKNQAEKMFVRLMLQGKISAALRWIGSQQSNRLEVTKEVRDTLQEKHPPSAELRDCATIKGPVDKVENVIFENIDAGLIQLCAKRTHGSAGPSGMDSEGWARLLCSRQFKSKPSELCESIAVLARRLCCDFVNPHYIRTLTSSRLIPLDKNPGIRPVGVGEVLRRIIGRAVTTVLKPELIDSTGPIQVCAGIPGGIEAAIHAVRKMYEDPNTEAVLLVDADNAFNSLNRKAALNNIRYICPEFSTYLVNTYRSPSNLYIPGETEALQSREGTTQGDNAAMGKYSCSLMPLLANLSKEEMGIPKPKQVWYADDAAGSGSLDALHSWWRQLVKEGPWFGYHPKPSKTWLIVKEEYKEKAEELFPDTQITCTGHKYLGSYIGTEEGKCDFVSEKIKEWKSDINALADIARREPQLAYAGFIYGTSKRWTFVARTTPNMSEAFRQLDWLINETFVPAIIGKDHITDLMKTVFTLPAKMGGLGIRNINEISELEYQNSLKLTEELTSQIFNQSRVMKLDDDKLELARSEVKKANLEFYKHKRNMIYERMEISERRQLDLASEKGASTWLTTLPLSEYGFQLNKQEFNDAILLRYNFKIKNVAPVCVCGERNSVNHALICKVGGYVSLRHNHLRDTTADLLKQVCKDVQTEPHCCHSVVNYLHLEQTQLNRLS